MMEGWVQKGVVALLLPIEKDFNKLTWRPTYYDGQIPPVSTRKRDEGPTFQREILAMFRGGLTTVYKSVTTIGT